MRWELLLYRILLIDKRILGDIFLNFLYYKQIRPCLILYNYDIARQKCRGLSNKSYSCTNANRRKSGISNFGGYSGTNFS